MNDKFKGLVLGLSLGIMLTGTAAYAGGSQIEVYFKELKYMFDGVQKQPSAEQGGAGFIHNGTTYVPLRFVSEALGKEVKWDEASGTIWVGKYSDPTAMVAAYTGGELLQGDLDRFLAMNRVLGQSDTETDEQPGYKESMAKRLIGFRLLASRLSEEDRTALAPQVEQQYAQLSSQLASRSGQEIGALLSSQGIDERYVKDYLSLVSAVEEVLKQSATEEKLKAAYDAGIAANPAAYTTASVRHILIGFEDAEGKERSKEDAKKKADELVAKLKGGADFATLAKENTEDPGSKENGGLYENADVSNWVEAFKNAAVQLELNKVSDPVETEYGYHVMRVEARSVKSFEQIKDQLVQESFNETYSKFMNEELPGLIQKLEIPGAQEQQ